VMTVARYSVMKGRLSNTRMPLDTTIVNSSTQHITVAPAPLASGRARGNIHTLHFPMPLTCMDANDTGMIDHVMILA